VVIGPAIRDLASVRHFYNGKFAKFDHDENYNAKEDFSHFGDFIDKFVLKGQLDKIYNNDEHEAMNIVPFQKQKKTKK